MTVFKSKIYISNYNEYKKSIGSLDFINEISYTKLGTTYKIQYIKNKIFANEFDYDFIFTCESSGVDYILQFVYYKDYVGPFTNNHLYNVSFTTYNQYLKSLSAKTELDKETIYEEITNNGDYRELIQRLIYIFDDFNNNMNPHNNSIYVVGETTNPIKIKWYLKSIFLF
jgi:hypothetical protein